MFRKSKETNVLEGGEVITFLEKGTHFKGILSFEGTVRVDGEIEGEIMTRGTLIVGEQGIIGAEINAGTVIVGGRINGDIHATRKIQLLPKSVVTGSMAAPSMIIEEGALFNGICEMKRMMEPVTHSERHLLG
jgi:cytoskeletal protein CcmA (bactofilin family)